MDMSTDDVEMLCRGVAGSWFPVWDCLDQIIVYVVFDGTLGFAKSPDQLRDLEPFESEDTISIDLTKCSPRWLR